MRTVANGGKRRARARDVGIDVRRQARRDGRDRVVGQRGLAVGAAGHAHRPGLAWRRRAVQGDQRGSRHAVAERRSAGQELCDEAAGATPHENDLGAVGQCGEVFTRRQAHGQRQRARDVGNGLALGDRMRCRARDATGVEPDGPGRAYHRRAGESHQRDAGRAFQHALVGVDDQALSHGEAVAGPVEHHQGRAIAGGGVIGRRGDVDRLRQAQRN